MKKILNLVLVGMMRTWRLLSLAAVLTGVMTGTVISADTVKVFRYDGSLQCGMGQAVPLDEMAKELNGCTH
jgi:heme A synthase